jgi:drug/metabolite transporter (DMT)-like permease
VPIGAVQVSTPLRCAQHERNSSTPVAQPIALAVLAAALFGAALVSTHSGLKYMDALSGARVSVPTAGLLFWLCAPFLDWARWQWTAAGIFALVGLFFPAAVTLLTFEANRRMGPTVAGTIGSTAPLFAVLGAAVFLGEALDLRELVATSLIMLGSMVLSRSGREDAAAPPLAAFLLPWSAAVLRALAQVLTKAGLGLWASPFAAALVGYTVSAAVVWTAGAVRGNAGWFALNRQGASWFAFTGVLNGLAVLTLYAALDTGPVHLVSPLVATYPLFTLALNAAWLKRERLTTPLMAGVALTVSGVVILLVRW